jgi:hypothetical protein
MRETLKTLRKVEAMRNRANLSRARHDTRAWVMARRERTRYLIELGGLVVKSKLGALTDDDRAALYGAFVSLALLARGEDSAQTLELWRRRGRRAFEAEARGANTHDSRRYNPANSDGDGAE